MLRRCELHLRRFPQGFEKLRTEVHALKERVWERCTGKKPDFREQFELMRREPEINRREAPEFLRAKDQGLGRDRPPGR